MRLAFLMLTLCAYPIFSTHGVKAQEIQTVDGLRNLDSIMIGLSTDNYKESDTGMTVEDVLHLLSVRLQVAGIKLKGQSARDSLLVEFSTSGCEDVRFGTWNLTLYRDAFLVNEQQRPVRVIVWKSHYGFLLQGKEDNAATSRARLESLLDNFVSQILTANPKPKAPKTLHR